MDVVEFASAEVGRGGCRCGFSRGLKLVGWMFFKKPLTVSYGISHEKTSIRKKHDSVRPEIWMKNPRKTLDTGHWNEGERSVR